jgi:catechol 2,3-dioxygenase-like lactoylglutathione lyase family enzyme
MEVNMAGTNVSGEPTSGMQSALGVDMKLEVVTLPVSDVDRAKRFYQSLGWRLDADIVAGEAFHVIQMTPPRSQCSIHFGTGLTASEPGSADRMILAVTDIETARDDLISRGVDVGEVYEARPPGFDQEGRSYFAYASFSDPDGNGWLLQEITTRLPGREWED